MIHKDEGDVDYSDGNDLSSKNTFLPLWHKMFLR